MKVRNDLSNHRSLTNEISKNSKLHHFTDEQVKAANNANLLDFIEDSGVDIRRTGHDSYKGVEHDSLVITPSKNSFYWNSRSVGGVGALDFATKYLLADSNLDNREKFQKGMNLVIKSSAGQFIPHKEILRDFSFNQRQVAKQFNQAYAYLTKTRKINPDLIKQLHKAGLIEQNQYGDALFLWRDPVNYKIKGASIQGTKINYQKYGKRGTLKKIEANSTKGFGFNFTVGKPENLYFFEAPIDAMSYYCLHPKLKNSQFIAMDGLKKNVFANYFQIAEKQLQQVNSGIKTINFGVDNDEAGTNFMKTFEESPGLYKHLVNAQGEIVPINRVSPTTEDGKDWNEVLKHKRSTYQPKHLSFEKKQFKLTPEYVTTYASSYLERLLNDYSLNSQYSYVKSSQNKINTLFGNPKYSEILGLAQFDTNDLMLSTKSIAKNQFSKNKSIDPQDLANNSLKLAIANDFVKCLNKPRLGAAHTNLSMNQEEIRRQVSASQSYFSKKAAEIESFEKNSQLSTLHHLLKEQDRLLNRSTNNLSVITDNNKNYTLNGNVTKGNEHKIFSFKINKSLLTNGADQLNQLFNKKLSIHRKSISESYRKDLVNQNLSPER